MMCYSLNDQEFTQSGNLSFKHCKHTYIENVIWSHVEVAFLETQYDKAFVILIKVTFTLKLLDLK